MLKPLVFHMPLEQYDARAAGVMWTLDATMELMFEGCIHFNSLMLPSGRVKSGRVRKTAWL